VTSPLPLLLGIINEVIPPFPSTVPSRSRKTLVAPDDQVFSLSEADVGKLSKE
jgi:hypothetical protein